MPQLSLTVVHKELTMASMGHIFWAVKTKKKRITQRDFSTAHLNLRLILSWKTLMVSKVCGGKGRGGGRKGAREERRERERRVSGKGRRGNVKGGGGEEKEGREGKRGAAAGGRIKGKRKEGRGEMRVGELLQLKKGKGEDNNRTLQLVMGGVRSECEIKRVVENCKL